MAEMNGMIDLYAAERKHEEFLAAQIAACVVNFSMDHPKRPVDVRDLMPSEHASERSATVRKDGQDALGRSIRRTFAVLEKVEEGRKTESREQGAGSQVS